MLLTSDLKGEIEAPGHYFRADAGGNIERQLDNSYWPIFWAPNIVPGSQGNAIVSFYPSDKTGSYSLIVEGTDGSGSPGRCSGKINVRGK